MSTDNAAPSQDANTPPRSSNGKTPASPSGKKPAIPSGKLPPGFSPRKKKKTKSGLEEIKEKSEGLRGPVPKTLQAETDHFDEAGRQILKFHGIYQQDDRDRRGQDGKHYFFMVRSKLPGGQLTGEQYLAHDALADRYANGTLRVTTRQGFQFHGVLKGDMKAHLQALNEALVTTLGACGDVVRNTMCCPAPTTDPLRQEIQRYADQIADHFTPRTQAYHDIWLDGEKVYDGKEHVETKEPIYGESYLPRKFKIGLAYPGDNCIDVYTQDVGLIAVADGDDLRGFNLLVGGGLGNTHKKPNTYPRLGDLLAFVPADEVLDVVEKIVIIQRDHGDRKNRKHARLKYLIDDWGLDRFQEELEDQLGYALAAPVDMPPLELHLHHGWKEQGDGRWYLGLSVENGRIKDEGALRLKTGLREVVERFDPGVRLTPNHDVLLTDLREEDRAGVEALLEAYGIALPESLSNTQKYSMACPAMPTCGLAITESERVFPQVIDALEEEIARLGLEDETLTVRMTGCPNGCARPYVADIGLVGRSLDMYTVYLGGHSNGTRMNEPFKDLVPLEELVDTVQPILAAFKRDRREGETFGDFCQRVGVDALNAVTQAA